MRQNIKQYFMDVLSRAQSVSRPVWLGFGLGLVVLAGLVVFVKSTGLGGANSGYPRVPSELLAFDYADDRPPVAQTMFKNDAGEELTLSDFEGQVILVNFWATWCAPCLREMPTLDRLRQAMASDKFDVLAISVDREGPELAKKFLADLDTEHLAFYIDETGMINFDMKTIGLPTTVLIGADGREIGRLTGTAEWDDPKVQRFLKRFLEEENS
jgi:thiol-disulfide isomerase/thioredoxin